MCVGSLWVLGDWPRTVDNYSTSGKLRIWHTHRRKLEFLGPVALIQRIEATQMSRPVARGHRQRILEKLC